MPQTRTPVSRITSLVLVVALVGGFLWVASRAEGYVTPEPDLHDAGVWVTRADQRRLGRTNTEIQVVDTSLTVATAQFDVLQSGADIVVHQQAPAALLGVDPVTTVTIPGPELPDDAIVAMAGPTGAVLDPGSGELHVVPASGLLGVEIGGGEDEATVVLDGAIGVAVADDGTVHALQDDGTVRTYAADGEPVGEARIEVDEDADELALAAAGDAAVVLDRGAATLHTTDLLVDVAAAGDRPLLQATGASESRVLVVGATTLLEVDLTTGDVEEVVGGGAGVPTRPVRLAGCDYVAWAGNGLVSRSCDGREPESRQYEQFATGGRLVWRVNRDRILLNELETGRQLVFGDGEPRYIDEWAEALSDLVEDTEDTEEDAAQVQEQTIDRTRNEPPIALDDEAGTRAGRPVIVRPLRNDSDPDGDVLVIDEISEVAAATGTATVVDGGRAVLVELAPDSDQLRFDYTISDGNDHTASASVVVSLVDEDTNRPPVAATGEQTTVVAGATVLHNVLAGAFDPDGDPISVVRAETEAATVTFESSGELAYQPSNAVGPDDVTYVLADDRGAEGSGLLRVNVVPAEVNEPPVARSDFASTLVGREVVIDVLENDTDANGDDITLVRLDDYSNANVRWDPESPEVRITADQPGTVNLVYRITDGQATDEGLVRVDVDEPASQFPPIAVRDDVRLSPGTPAFVPVLDNDVDEDGEVLLVVGVDVPADAPIDVQIVNRTRLRIETDRLLEDVVEFDYRITDGSNEAVGRVVVAPAPVREQNQPPVAGPDEYTVRAGGIAVLPVMVNDSDPDGDTISLVEPEPTDAADAAENGRLFLSDGMLRYEAPRQPKATVIESSTIIDSAANTASGQLLLHVVEADPELNTPPVAPTLTGRVLADGLVAIRVPLATMDPEGDAVRLLGVGEPPTLGGVVETGPDELVYRADDSSSGTDQFTYRVRDQFGLEAEGTVLVGIAGRSTTNNAPSAGDDLVNIVPGTTVTVPVLANDSDPDGDPIAVSTEADDELLVETGEVELVGGQIRYTAPASPPGTQTSFTYVLSDGRGGRDVGTVVAQFVDELPNRAPVPVDDLVEPQVAGELFTTAPLQANDVDDDGDALEVVSISLDATETTGLNDDGSVTLEMPAQPLQFTYEVTDGTEVRRGAVVVPLVNDEPPVAEPDTAAVEMLDEVTVDVLANDRDPEGADLVLLDVVGVRHGLARVEGDQVVFEANQDQFVGDAGFSYTVADSADPSQALISVGSVQVTIEGDVNVAPEFTSLTVEIPQDAQRTISLDAGVIDPDEDDQHTFTDLVGGGDGISARVDGSDLVIDASIDASVGTVQRFEVTAADDYESVVGEVTVTVASSDKPLVTTVLDVAETIQGQGIDVAVLGNDVNPFPGTPLTILDVTQPRNATVATNGSSVRFEPDPDVRDIGEVSFEYTVGDATGDPTREVVGTVNVTVIGRPSIPAAPTCIGGESEVVQIGWAAPAANGAPITEYVVRVTAGGTTEERRFGGGATVQSIDGLTNGIDHTFEVAAVNEAVVGDLEFSDPSPLCKPDQVPDKPEAPASVFGDGELDLTFQAPPVNGSAVSGLTLTNATTGESVPLGPTQTSYTWEGLENGTSYRFTLMATNERGDSPVSQLSTGDGIPAGVPLNPVAPTTERGDRFLTVRWQRPDENGDAIVEYRITIIRAGVEQGRISIPDGNQFQTQIDTDNGVEYQFQLEARNKAGWSARSPRSVAAVSAGRPFAITSVTASEGDTLSVLSFTAPNDNGASISRYEYSQNGGNWTTLAGDRTVRSLSNGSNYSFRVRAVNEEGAADPGATSNTINPYGRPGTPNVNASRSNRTITWNWGAVSGNGRTVVRYETRLDSGGWQNNGTSRTYSRSFGYAETHTLRVRAVTDASDSARRTSGEGSASARTVDPPLPTYTDTVSDAFEGGTCEQNSTGGGSWNRQATCTGSATWHTNGTALTFDCQRRAGSYTVTYVGGRTETWDLHLRVRGGYWVRAAAIQDSTAGGGNGSYPVLDFC